MRTKEELQDFILENWEELGEITESRHVSNVAKGLVKSKSPKVRALALAKNYGKRAGKKNAQASKMMGDLLKTKDAQGYDSLNKLVYDKGVQANKDFLKGSAAKIRAKRLK